MNNLIIKGKEIKERGLFGKTVYVIKNNEIKEPGFFGRTVYVIKGNEIKEPGPFGRTVYIIDGDTIKTPGIFGGAFLGEVVAKTKKDGSIVQYGKPQTVKDYNAEENKKETENISPTFKISVSCVEPEDEVKEVGTFIHNGITYHTIKTTKNGYTWQENIPEFNQVYVFFNFLNKYPIIKYPDIMKEEEYSHWTFSQIGIKNVKNLHQSLFSQGFYTEASNEETLSKYKVGDIKNIVSKLGLDIKGKKQDLINGLIAQVDKETLANNLTKEYTSISVKGQQWMKEHELEFAWHTAPEEFASLEEYKKNRT